MHDAAGVREQPHDAPLGKIPSTVARLAGLAAAKGWTCSCDYEQRGQYLTLTLTAETAAGVWLLRPCWVLRGGKYVYDKTVSSAVRPGLRTGAPTMGEVVQAMESNPAESWAQWTEAAGVYADSEAAEAFACWYQEYGRTGHRTALFAEWQAARTGEGLHAASAAESVPAADDQDNAEATPHDSRWSFGTPTEPTH
ncbi:hypothetical protein AB0N09_35880 [Streptomyces erythrochromogenes]|uniref:hypothetical protein n=1 Tax=Streptomyces erythrochromogenes TaxID=285574 RepID=UPI00341C778B